MRHAGLSLDSPSSQPRPFPSRQACSDSFGWQHRQATPVYVAFGSNGEPPFQLYYEYVGELADDELGWMLTSISVRYDCPLVDRFAPKWDSCSSTVCEAIEEPH